MKRYIRGSGFRHTLPAVFRFSALWVFLVVLTPPIVIVGMVLSDLVPPTLQGEVLFFLYTRTPLIALVAIGIAIFTTNRLAGPWIYLARALEKVEHADMDFRIRFRRSDTHLRDVEAGFNRMMVALNERVESRAGLESEDDGAT